MDFEQINPEDYKEKALAQIYKDLFNLDIKALEQLKASHSTIDIFNQLFDLISSKKSFMEKILETPYLIKDAQDLIWIDDKLPKLSDLIHLESDDFFKAVDNWLIAINIVLKEVFEKTKDVKYLDLIDINLKIKDSLVLGSSEDGVDSALIKIIFQHKNEKYGSDKKFS